MFTGIVQGTGRVVGVERKEQALSFVLDLGELARDLKLGASVSIAGVCLTVVAIEGTHVHFDVMRETLVKTALGFLRVDDVFNVERSAKVGDEIGGHVVSGHVAGVAFIRVIETPMNNHVITFACDPVWMPYILPKGFVALDGCSLTIVDVGTDWFTVHLIPETLNRTTFWRKQVGDQVHLEIDPMTRAIVDTVKRITQSL